MNRIFMFAYQPCQGNTGGGHGVEYRLYVANKKYKLLGDVYFVFGDRVIHNADDSGSLAKQSAETVKKKSTTKTMLKRMAPNICAGTGQLRKILGDEKRYAAYIDRLDERYRFDDGDVYIFHDMQLAHPFLKRYPFKKTMLVLHCQGSYYNEWKAFTNRSFEPLHWYFTKRLKDIVAKLRYLGFPAKGAEETLIESDPELASIVRGIERKYMYNGTDCPDIEVGSCADWIEELRGYPGYKFATVAALNAAKAVERIPQYLGALKQAGIDFKWILIGQGVKADEVQAEIKRAHIEENTVWVKDFISHDEILQLLSVTDFYILFHRQSVFDLSTLEAMHYGNIPILTPVGGNKDVILDDNGLFVSDFSDAAPLYTLIRNEDLEGLHKKNRDIQRLRFNDRSFLERYASLCDELLQAKERNGSL